MALRRNRNFRRLFLGRLVTNAGDSVYFIAAMWLVYDLTRSPFYTGVAAFLIQAPNALQMFAGPLVDRWSIRDVLVRTQAFQAVFVLVVPLAWLFDHLSVWIVLVLMPLLTLVNQVVYPAQNAAIPRIVSDTELVRANSLFSMAYQGVDMTFNAAAGVLIAVVGAIALYVVDSLTFILAVGLFFGLQIPPAQGDGGEDTDTDYLGDLRAGIDYVRGSVLLTIVAGAVVLNFAFGIALAVLPDFAAVRGGATLYGLLMAALSAGSLAGALGASALERFPFGWVGIVGLTISAGTWFAASTATYVPGMIALFFVAFVPIGIINVMIQAMVQSTVPQGLLGRVTALTASATGAMIPVGGLVGGVAAESIGSITTLSLTASGFAFLAVYFLVRPTIRTLPRIDEATTERLGLPTPD